MTYLKLSSASARAGNEPPSLSGSMYHMTLTDLRLAIVSINPIYKNKGIEFRTIQIKKAVIQLYHGYIFKRKCNMRNRFTDPTKGCHVLDLLHQIDGPRLVYNLLRC